MLLVDEFKHLYFVPADQYLIKVFNAFKPTNVLSIPHFDIPVIIRGKTFLINDYWNENDLISGITASLKNDYHDVVVAISFVFNLVAIFWPLWLHFNAI